MYEQKSCLILSLAHIHIQLLSTSGRRARYPDNVSLTHATYKGVTPPRLSKLVQLMLPNHVA